MKNVNTKTYEKSFRSQWSATLEKEGFTQISNIFLKNYSVLRISVQEAMFLIQLFSYKWTVESPYPSLNSIASRMGKSSDVVRGYARSLERKGFIKRTFRKNETNSYSVTPLIDALEALMSPVKMQIGGLQNSSTPSVNLQTKEDPLRIPNNKKDIESIKEILLRKMKY